LSRSDELRAELDMVELEDKLVEAKKKHKPDSKHMQDLKAEVREARQKFREAREARAPDAGVARAEPVKAKARGGGQ
jgi:uncharacterized coiled-coil DUF342 family protein